MSETEDGSPALHRPEAAGAVINTPLLADPQVPFTTSASGIARKLR